MANLTDERLKKMEDEMNRFEEEILTSQSVGDIPGPDACSKRQKVDILEKVQAHLAKKPLVPPPPPPPTTAAPKSADSIPKNVLAAALIPPPPPPPVGQIGPTLPESGPRMAPPPPPPGFLPPQLRHRPPMAPPPRMPMPPPYMMPPHGGMRPPHMYPGGPMAPPPPPPHMMGGPPSMPMGQFPPRPMFPPGMNMNMNMPGMRPQQTLHNMPPVSYGYMQNCPPVTTTEPPQYTQPIVAQPKIVYAAAPVRTLVSAKEKGCLGSTVMTTEVKINPTNITTASTDANQVAPGIEVFVPVEKIEAEKRQNFGVAMPTTDESASCDAAKTASGSTQATTSKKEKKEKKKKFVRMAAGTVWEDTTLADWDPDDFRLFCGDLGNEVTDEYLIRAFNRYPSFQKAKVIRDKRSQKTKGFGFVSFKDPNDFARAMREMNGKYVGNRPIKLRKSMWQDRQIDIVKKKDKEKKRLGFR